MSVSTNPENWIPDKRRYFITLMQKSCKSNIVIIQCWCPAVAIKGRYSINARVMMGEMKLSEASEARWRNVLRMVHYFEAFDAVTMVTSAGRSFVLHLYASINSKTMMRVRVYVVSLSPSSLIIWSVKVNSMKLTTEFTALPLNTGTLSSTSHIQNPVQHLFDKCDITRPRDGHVIFGGLKIDSSCHNTSTLKAPNCVS